MNEEAAWNEWRRRCALGRCRLDTRRLLREFAFLRFRRFMACYARRTNAEGQSALHVDSRDAWHRFETHLALKHTRRGKRYKEWLFARVGRSETSALDTLRGGASLIVRDAVREYLRRECPPPFMDSLNRPVSADGEFSVTLGDLLPGAVDTSRAVELAEYEALSQRHARALFDEMSPREKIAVLSRQCRLPLSHPDVAKAAGCGKSLLSAACHDVVRRLAQRLKAEYPDDGPEALLQLGLMTFEAVGKLIFLEKKSEKTLRRFFMSVERIDEKTA